jgi:hypothetical protein
MMFSGIETSDSSIDARVFLVETTILAIKAPFSDAEANVGWSPKSVMQDSINTSRGNYLAGAGRLNHKDLEDRKEQASSGEPVRRQSASSMAGNFFGVFAVFAVQFLAQR